MAAQYAGYPLRPKSIGRWQLRIGGLCIPAARESIEMLYQFEQPFVVDDTKFRRAFGGEATPIATGVARTVDWYRARCRA